MDRNRSASTRRTGAQLARVLERRHSEMSTSVDRARIIQGMIAAPDASRHRLGGHFFQRAQECYSIIRRSPIARGNLPLPGGTHSNKCSITGGGSNVCSHGLDRPSRPRGGVQCHARLVIRARPFCAASGLPAGR